MKTYKNFYSQLISLGNLTIAWPKSRKGKTARSYVIEFEKNLEKNLLSLHEELKSLTYKPKPLQTFILRDPKTRKISKSEFRDRIVHHAIVNILEPIFDKTFIQDSCAYRKHKGTIYALKRFDYFLRKVTNNKTKDAFVLKADIRHYFQEIDLEILTKLIEKKINDSLTIELIQKINTNSRVQRERELILKEWVVGENLVSLQGMPLGNLTSQFFANVYLNELDYFIKHNLKAKYYIRYVDDFVLLHKSKEQLEKWKQIINQFLIKQLRIQLHSQKSRVVTLTRGIDFVGFRNFRNHKLLRKRNIKLMKNKVKNYQEEEIDFRKISEIYQGWQAYAKWANTFKVKNKMKQEIINILWNQI